MHYIDCWDNQVGLAEKRRMDYFYQNSHLIAWTSDHLEDQEEFILMPEEAFFLVFALGAIDVVCENDSILSIKDLWNRLTAPRPLDLLHLNNQLNDESKISNVNGIDTSRFEVRYAVYHYYRSRGWIVR